MKGHKIKLKISDKDLLKLSKIVFNRDKKLFDELSGC